MVGELVLPRNALQDRLLTVGELAEEADAFLNGAQDFFIETAGAFLAVAGDEGNGVILVEELHHGFDLHLADLEVLRDPREVQTSDVLLRGGRCLHVVRLSCSLARWPGDIENRALQPAVRRACHSLRSVLGVMAAY